MGQPFGGFGFFTMKEMYDVHCAAMDLIRSCGLEIQNDELLRMSGDAEIPVDLSARRIYPTEESVLETIRQFTGAQTPEITDTGTQKPPLQRKIVSNISTHIGSNHGFVLEPDGDSWSLRHTTRQDVKNLIKLRRALGCRERGPGMIPQDVPPEVSPIHAAAIQAKYSTEAGRPDSKDTTDMEWITRVMQAAGRWDEDREFTTGAYAKSPLCLCGRDADIALYQAKRGWLTRIVGVPIFGATSPCTLAGHFAQTFAEGFGFLTFSRLITPPPNNVFKPGPFGVDPIEMDLRRGDLILGSPREPLCRNGMTQIVGEFYKMPGASSGCYMSTDAAVPGPQASIEKALSLFAAITGGVYTDSDRPVEGSAGLGIIVANLALCAEQAVLDNETVSYVNKFLQGIDVDEESLAVDVIKEVGPSGEFVSTDHTLRHFRDVSWHSDYFHRGPFDAWVAGGRRSPLDLAREKIREAMELELSLVIPEDRAREVDRVVAEAERALLG